MYMVPGCLGRDDVLQHRVSSCAADACRCSYATCPLLLDTEGDISHLPSRSSVTSRPNPRQWKVGRNDPSHLLLAHRSSLSCVLASFHYLPTMGGDQAREPGAGGCQSHKMEGVRVPREPWGRSSPETHTKLLFGQEANL